MHTLVLRIRVPKQHDGGELIVEATGPNRGRVGAGFLRFRPGFCSQREHQRYRKRSNERRSDPHVRENVAPGLIRIAPSPFAVERTLSLAGRSAIRCPLTEPSCHAEVLLRLANHETPDRSPFDPSWARPTTTVGGGR
jgi:hypothetical protein